MTHSITQHRQRGAALVVALLFLLVVTIIGVTASWNSSLSLKMSTNMQDQYDSLQSAEAAVFATVALAGDVDDDPFRDRGDRINPFAGVDPLDSLNDPNSVTAEVVLANVNAQCPTGGWSVEYKCDLFRIDALHDKPRRARTQLSLGVARRLNKQQAGEF
ncbi:MAG: hypothetical protein CME59_01615 [Halioglobus sp.]|nr:hypothetical protein [Halioglobus sp.]|tara:strand:+ start:1380 stop:1859 length:480 start_codon:yes stop_codon:yes gene_type:complete